MSDEKYLYYRHVIVPLQLPITTEQCGNVIVINSNITW